MLKLFIILIVFLCGLYFCLNYEQAVLNEAFDNMDKEGKNKPSCPNILIKSGNELLLKNTKLAEIPGVNPLRFKNLEEYVQFTEWQRSQGINCPILFLHHSYGAQGKNVYRIRPGPNELRGGIILHSKCLPTLKTSSKLTNLIFLKPLSSNLFLINLFTNIFGIYI